MAFDPMKDNIAIALNYLKLLKSSDIFDSYSEPYVVCLCVDASDNKNPLINYKFQPFPKVREGGSVAITGDGLVLYGPRNPGEFVALSLLFMESDQDVRATGEMLKELITSQAVALGLKAIISANPGSAAMVGIIKELALFVSSALAKNGDDELFRIEGSFLRDQSQYYPAEKKRWKYT